MGSAERLTIVEQESAIGDVERCHPDRKTLTERLSQRTIEGCVRLQVLGNVAGAIYESRSEEHTSELQSPDHLVCRLLLEKKNLHTPPPAPPPPHPPPPPPPRSPPPP